MLAWMKHSDWSLWHNRLQHFNLAKLHVNNKFCLVLSQFICTSYLLVCKHTNKKKDDDWTSSDWKLIYSAQNVLHSDWSTGCNLLQGLSSLYCIPTCTNFWRKNLTLLTWKLDCYMLQLLFELKFESKVKCIVTTL